MNILAKTRGIFRWEQSHAGGTIKKIGRFHGKGSIGHKNSCYVT
jgi:hypothetical protein